MALTRVDDRSSDITFSGVRNWGRGGAPDDYNNSVTYAQYAGQAATLSFRGTGIAVFGHIMRKTPGIPPPVSTYSINGGSPTTYNEFQDGDEHNNQQFYQSPVLSNGRHTIVVTNVFDNHAAYFLDYFLVVAGADTPPPPPPTVATVVNPVIPSSSSSTTTTGRSSSSSTSSTVSASSLSRSLRVSTSMINGTIMTLVPVTNIPSSESVSSFNTSPSSTSPSATMVSSAASTSPNLQIHTGIIVGTSIGGVAAIALSAFVVYFCLRKRRRAEYDWRMISGFANQPSSQWLQQVASGGIQSKFPSSLSQPTESPSFDHSTISGRPPSYSQVEPLHPAYVSSIQNPRPSKFPGYLDP